MGAIIGKIESSEISMSVRLSEVTVEIKILWYIGTART